MHSVTMYSKQIKGHSHVFKETVAVYRAVVDYLINVCIDHWAKITLIPGRLDRQRCVESFVHVTKYNPSVPYSDFDVRFYKLPSYLRRSAIMEAIGKVSSYMSHMQIWENTDRSSRGAQPGFPRAGFVFPCMYNGNMYEAEGQYFVRLKVYIHNTWDWITVPVRKSDADYIAHHCRSMKESTPTLRKRGKLWYLDFAYETKVELCETPVEEQTILAVDLGINNACTCSAMKADGTVIGRHFLSLPKENDCLNRRLARIKNAQRGGAKHMPRLWGAVKGINDRIAVLTAQFVIDTAVLYNTDVIVMEHLDTSDKKHGSKKQRLHFWCAQYVQAMVTGKAHRLGMRVSTVCAWSTSRLAFDGSGPVLRGRKSEKTAGNYSLCEFSSGKVYHCDLNATYNIGARYFVRAITKSLSATVRQLLEAKVPSAVKRSTCTLSTLISLNAVLSASAAAS